MSIKQVDVLIVGTLLALGFVQLVSVPPEHPQPAALLSLAMTMPVLVRRSWPLAVTISITAAAAAYTTTIDPDPPFAGFLALIVMAYTLGRFATLTTTVVGAGLVAAAVIATSLTRPTAWFEWVYPIVYLAGALAVGRFVRHRSDRQEVEADVRVREAVADERGRVARELHDVVAHGLGVMVLHAEAADELLTSDPGAARRSLKQVQRSGREAIGELTLLLALLREGEPGEGHEPQPLLGQLPSLAQELEHHGREIHLAVRGDVDSVPAGIQLTTYRVVQEALTNVAKHSEAPRVEVAVTVEAHLLVAQVFDEGPRRMGGRGGGRGLIGMQERAMLYGGSVVAQPAGDGFRVRLTVPLP